MKTKIVILIVMLLLTTGVSSCDLFYTDDNIDGYIDEIIPDMIVSNIELPKEYNDFDLKWIVDSKEVSETLYLPFRVTNSTLDVELVATKGNKTLTYLKNVLIKQSNIISSIYIHTNNYQPIYSKTEYVNAVLTLSGNQEAHDLNGESIRIRGRGNSTWYTHPKKPYRINFDSRTSVLGMSSAKNYALLAEHSDKSFLRNFFVHMISKDLNIDYTLETRYIELYINALYQGLYLLTEHVEADKNKLFIEDNEREDAGFLLEMETDDRIYDEGIENINWFRQNDRNYVVKYPDIEDYTQDIINGKISYMKNYLNNTYNSLFRSDYGSFLDIDQFIDYMIISELVKVVDIDYSSVYLHKKDGELLKFGPLWDYDISMGNGDYGYVNGIPLASYQGFWTVKNTYLNALLKNESFKIKYVERFRFILDEYFDKWLNDLGSTYTKIYPYAVRNFERWDILNSYVWPNPDAMVNANTYQKQYEYLYNWLFNRRIWLYSNLDSISSNFF